MPNSSTSFLVATAGLSLDLFVHLPSPFVFRSSRPVVRRGGWGFRSEDGEGRAGKLGQLARRRSRAGPPGMFSPSSFFPLTICCCCLRILHD